MGKIIDLTNQKFGHLTVLNMTDKRASDRSIIWHCKCDCGNEKDVSGTLLRRGEVQSCGCMTYQIIREKTLKIIPKGTRFGRLVIENFLEDKKGNFYQCKCDCGNIVIVPRNNLIRNHTESCGCLQKEKASFQKQIDLTGKRFGMLIVEKMLNEQDNHGNHFCLCKCDCGQYKKVTIAKLQSGHTISCGCQKSKGELQIIQLLQKNNIKYEYQKNFLDCKFNDTQYYAYFDFYIDNRYIIEFDGEQHFAYRGNGWNTETNFLKIQEHDKVKNEYCKTHNIPLIRIPYTRLKDLCLEDLLLETTQWRVV